MTKSDSDWLDFCPCREIGKPSGLKIRRLCLNNMHVGSSPTGGTL